jgi:formylglycine-generating enzyme required for sulfatase activity
LTTVFKIRDAAGERKIQAGDFPIIAGSGAGAHITLGDLDENQDALYIGLSENRLFVQPAESGVSVLYNRQQLKGSEWLFHGDRLQIGSDEIRFRVENNAAIFEVLRLEDQPEFDFPSPAARPGENVVIEPLSFRNGDRIRPSTSRAVLAWFGWIAVGVVFVLLATAAWYVFTARQVTIQIEPEPDRVSIKGGLAGPRLGAYYLLRPGKYTLQADKACYQRLAQQVVVGQEKKQHIALEMEKLPGRLSVEAHQAELPSIKIEKAAVYIDGSEAGATPLSELQIKPGPHKLEIRAENYQILTADISVEGCGKLQALEFEMAPNWSDITIASEPQGAEVIIDGDLLGKTPLQIQLTAGTYQMEVRAERFKGLKTQLNVQPNQPQVIDDIRLQPADGMLTVITTPAGANVVIGKEYAGQTPLKTAVAPDTRHVVQISKNGYSSVSRNITIPVSGAKTLKVNLEARKGIIRFRVQPADAQLVIDGQSLGKTPQELSLIAVKHQLEFSKDGYTSYRTEITPRPGYPQELKIILSKQVPQEKAPAETIQTENGYTLKLIRPRAFTMGSSRREQGRRSNETLREVKLQRPFYMGIKEITNGEFRQFMAGHRSGSFKNKSLNRDDQPVVQVTWEQAALFCNWLSAKQSLPPAYVKKGDKLTAVVPLSTGYRLPTEAEWEYCARRSKNQEALKYAWGSTFPPPAQSGNFADISAKDLLNSYLKTYNDGYPVTAPPAKFKANEQGIYDLGGNVAEWCHDYYAIYPFDSQRVDVDPAGPDQGDHHVVRGSSWKHDSISELRLAFRDYARDRRDDLGFRICRYLE